MKQTNHRPVDQPDNQPVQPNPHSLSTMVYESQISFTLDTICPWTYLARRRLSKALAQLNQDSPDSTVKFTTKYLPYQLYPDFSTSGVDKSTWYKQSKYGDSEDKFDMYKQVMSAYGEAEGIEFKFGGEMANTLPAHRMIQYYQELKGPECAEKMVTSLYRQYFEEEKNPSSRETLTKAAVEAGIGEKEVGEFLDDEREGLMEVKMLIQEQAGNGIDAVPYVSIEGKRRDFTIEGCQEVKDYLKALQQVVKESG